MSTDESDPKDVEDPKQESDADTQEKEETLLSAAGAAKTANRAINETLDKYFAAAGLDLEDILERIRDRPTFYMALSAGVGFIAGGGMTSKLGLMLLGLAGRRAATETATNFGRQMVRRAAGSARVSA